MGSARQGLRDKNIEDLRDRQIEDFMIFYLKLLSKKVCLETSMLNVSKILYTKVTSKMTCKQHRPRSEIFVLKAKFGKKIIE